MRPLLLLSASLAILLASCGVKQAPDPSAADGVLDCETIAIKGADGEPDPCDLQACQECVDFCATDCNVQESFPPGYACPSVGSWTVYDFCEDWEDSGGR